MTALATHFEKHKDIGAYVPRIFSLSQENDARELAELFESGRITTVVDDFEEEERELYALQNPAESMAPDFEEHFCAYREEKEREVPAVERGVWVYFPWRATLTHVLTHDDFFAVRTSRNKKLITKDEQKKYYNTVVGIGGMSIGSSIAVALALQGGARHIKLADFDRLALSNTNRVRAGVCDLGTLKTTVTARQIYEINPFVEVEVFSDGLTEKTMDDFFEGTHPLGVVIDELDNMAVKYRLREYARRLRLPLLMAADNADSSVIDIERYDIDADTPFFHGRLGEVTHEELAGLDKIGIGRAITKHVGVENVTERMQDSLLALGKEIVSWPQLGGAALLNGAAVAYCVRKIVLGEPLENNRAIISFDRHLATDYDSPEKKKAREDAADTFRKLFKL